MRFALTLLFCLAPCWARAGTSDDGFKLYAAAGSALGIGAARIGYGSWEAGVLNQQTVGFDKQSKLERSLYAAFGFGLALSSKTGVAAFGAFGWQPHLFWNVSFRGEMNASAASNGMVIGQLAAGLSVRF